MKDAKILNELEKIVAHADEVKIAAADLRRRIEEENGAPRMKRQKALTEQQVADLRASIRNDVNKKATT